jgi:transposase
MRLAGGACRVHDVAVLLRVSWRAVSGIVTRVVAELAGTADRLDGLRKIGIDEIAYRKGHRYLLAVTDHETGGLAWAAEGRNAATLRAFFDALGWTGRRGSRMCPLTARSGSTTWCARRRARR